MRSIGTPAQVEQQLGSHRGRVTQSGGLGAAGLHARARHPTRQEEDKLGKPRGQRTKPASHMALAADAAALRAVLPAPSPWAESLPGSL